MLALKPLCADEVETLHRQQKLDAKQQAQAACDRQQSHGSALPETECGRLLAISTVGDAGCSDDPCKIWQAASENISSYITAGSAYVGQ